MQVLRPAPEPGELPARFPSPFAVPPHPIAQRAADELVAALEGGLLADAGLFAPGGGKMFGVLVVADRAGRVGVLRGFSGMVGGRWEVDGFVPPLFDAAARDAFWPAGEAALAALEARVQALAAGPEAAAARTALAALDAEHAAALAALQEVHRVRRRARRDERAGLGPGAMAARAALDQQSRGDTAELRRLRAAHAAARAAPAARVAALDAERDRAVVERAERSRALWERLHDTYPITSARGERTSLRALFGAEPPPGGAGDCAGPKLLGAAYRAGLRPLALAEVWWGAPPATGGRHAGVSYPSCRGKCGVILPHMLDGLDAEPAPVFGGAAIAADEPRAVYEDDWVVVVDKPVGLLSVPGRSGQLRDSVQVRLRARYAGASGPLVVHRLDLDTSGLVLVAKDAETHAALQRMFARREIEKRYVAWLDAVVAADAGVVELPLRVDLEDRPRQLHDPVHGKSAVTEWRVLERAGGRTRVALVPRTGRTHQLRVHAAHPLGIGAPIVGDRLYGRIADRLLLHAESLAFIHPRTGARVEVVRPAPF
jgi:tRNA pseudouridine32 synthase/23S rRNA pseudouridine746 synthase